jgi:hypothetical protein
MKVIIRQVTLFFVAILCILSIDSRSPEHNATQNAKPPPTQQETTISNFNADFIPPSLGGAALDMIVSTSYIGIQQCETSLPIDTGGATGQPKYSTDIVDSHYDLVACNKPVLQLLSIIQDRQCEVYTNRYPVNVPIVSQPNSWHNYS